MFGLQVCGVICERQYPNQCGTNGNSDCVNLISDVSNWCCLRTLHPEMHQHPQQRQQLVLLAQHLRLFVVPSDLQCTSVT